MIRHVVMWELHDPAQAPAFRTALLPCARLVAGTTQLRGRDSRRHCPHRCTCA